MIAAPPLTRLEPLVAAALQRQGPCVGDDELQELITDWALQLRARGESKGGTSGAIGGIVWRTACRIGLPGHASSICDVRLEVERYIDQAIGPIESRPRGKNGR